VVTQRPAKPFTPVRFRSSPSAICSTFGTVACATCPDGVPAKLKNRLSDPPDNEPDGPSHEVEGDDETPLLFAAWLSAIRAALMLHHLEAVGASWPQANLYCHSCITALRSVTFMLQKALRDRPGFEESYADVQDHFATDPELIYLRDACNYVLKEGALELLASYYVSYAGPFQWEMRGIGPDGPDLRLRSPDSDEYVPADWRRLDGFVFRVPMRFAPVDGLPDPPDRELQQVLAEALGKLRLILHEAEAHFDAENADAEQAEAEARQFGRPWRDPRP
jgi:hypothetical protein